MKRDMERQTHRKRNTNRFLKILIRGVSKYIIKWANDIIKSYVHFT